MQLLARALARCPTVEMVRLDNRYDPQRPSLNHMTSSLDQPNHVRDGGAAAFAELLAAEGCALRELHLAGCHIGDAGFEALAGALPRNGSLRVLGLERNEPREAGQLAILNALTADGASDTLARVTGVAVPPKFFDTTPPKARRPLAEQAAAFLRVVYRCAQPYWREAPALETDRDRQQRVMREATLRRELDQVITMYTQGVTSADISGDKPSGGLDMSQLRAKIILTLLRENAYPALKWLTIRLAAADSARSAFSRGVWDDLVAMIHNNTSLEVLKLPPLPGRDSARGSHDVRSRDDLIAAIGSAARDEHWPHEGVDVPTYNLLAEVVATAGTRIRYMSCAGAAWVLAKPVEERAAALEELAPLIKRIERLAGIVGTSSEEPVVFGAGATDDGQARRHLVSTLRDVLNNCAPPMSPRWPTPVPGEGELQFSVFPLEQQVRRPTAARDPCPAPAPKLVRLGLRLIADGHCTVVSQVSLSGVYLSLSEADARTLVNSDGHYRSFLPDLARALAASPRTKELDLTDSGLHREADADFESLVEMIGTSTTLQRVDINGNRLREKRLRALGNAAVHNPALVTIGGLDGSTELLSIDPELRKLVAPAISRFSVAQRRTLARNLTVLWARTTYHGKPAAQFEYPGGQRLVWTGAWKEKSGLAETTLVMENLPLAKKLVAVVSAALSVADYVSDVVVLADFWADESKQLLFAAGAAIMCVSIVMGVIVLRREGRGWDAAFQVFGLAIVVDTIRVVRGVDQERVSVDLTLGRPPMRGSDSVARLKQLEALLESAPQLLLQAYAALRAETVDPMLLLSIVFSALSMGVANAMGDVDSVEAQARTGEGEALRRAEREAEARRAAERERAIQVHQAMHDAAGMPVFAPRLSGADAAVAPAAAAGGAGAAAKVSPGPAAPADGFAGAPGGAAAGAGRALAPVDDADVEVPEEVLLARARHVKPSDRLAVSVPLVSREFAAVAVFRTAEVLARMGSAALFAAAFGPWIFAVATFDLGVGLWWWLGTMGDGRECTDITPPRRNQRRCFSDDNCRSPMMWVCTALCQCTLFLPFALFWTATWLPCARICRGRKHHIPGDMSGWMPAILSSLLAFPGVDYLSVHPQFQLLIGGWTRPDGWFTGVRTGEMLLLMACVAALANDSVPALANAARWETSMLLAWVCIGLQAVAYPVYSYMVNNVPTRPFWKEAKPLALALNDAAGVVSSRGPASTAATVAHDAVRVGGAPQHTQT